MRLLGGGGVVGGGGGGMANRQISMEELRRRRDPSLLSSPALLHLSAGTLHHTALGMYFSPYTPLGQPRKAG